MVVSYSCYQTMNLHICDIMHVDAALRFSIIPTRHFPMWIFNTQNAKMDCPLSPNTSLSTKFCKVALVHKFSWVAMSLQHANNFFMVHVFIWHQICFLYLQFQCCDLQLNEDFLHLLKWNVLCSNPSILWYPSLQSSLWWDSIWLLTDLQHTQKSIKFPNFNLLQWHQMGKCHRIRYTLKNNVARWVIECL